MASSIALLPPHLIDRILGFDDTSYLSMALWMVGNGTLNKLLSESITYVELQNEGEFDVCCLPSYLTNLRSLRHLIVHRALNTVYLHVMNRKRTVSIVEGLSDTLETIIFRFLNSTSIFFPDDPTSTPHVQIDKTFPNLRRLHLDYETVWLPSFIPQLPSTLTDLQVTLPTPQASDAVALARVLPSTLQHLTLIFADDTTLNASFNHLPPALESLVAMSPWISRLVPTTPESLAKLPRSLISFVCTQLPPLPLGRQNIEESLRFDWAQGPRLLTWVDGTSPPPYIAALHIIETMLPKALQSFPAHLETLHLYSTELDPSMIRLLPRRLKELISRFKHFKGLERDDFPSTLRRLSVVSVAKLFSVSQVLQFPALTTFSYNGRLPLKVINALPTTLTSSIVSMDSLGALQLPPNLRSLTLYGDGLGSLGIPKPKGKIKRVKNAWDFPKIPADACAYEHVNFEAFPRTLRTLIVTRFVIPSSQLQHLPPGLTYLMLSSVFDDSLFDWSNPALIASVKKVNRDENYRFCTSDGKAQVTMFDLLPRSLEFLSLSGPFKVTHEAWSQLPPSLAVLIIVPTVPLNQGLLRYASLNHLKHLQISLNDLDDEHVAFLPSGLRLLNLITPENTASFTDRSLYFMTLFGTLYPGHALRQAWDTRAQTIRGFMALDDLQGLNRLLQEPRHPNSK